MARILHYFLWMVEKGINQRKSRSITGKIFHGALVCPRLGWEMRNNNVGKEPSLDGQYRREQRETVSRLARKLFPIGKFVGDADPERAAIQTQYLLGDPQVRIVFNATFIADGFVTRADILLKEPGGWHLKKVKPHINEQIDDIEDLAYVKMVAARSGLKTDGCALILLSSDYRLGMPYEKLFIERDCTKEAGQLASLLEPMMNPLEQITRDEERPPSGLRYECRECMLFEKCVGKDARHHIFSLPRLSKKKFYELRKHGITDILRIPTSLKLTEQQEIVRKSEITGKPHIGAGLSQKLASIEFPVFYLSFLSIASSLPFYYDIAPCEPIPILYSIHKCYEPGKVIDHREYIADPRRDCRREMAKQVIRDLEKEGSVVIYSPFEHTMMQQLATLNPDIAQRLLDATERFVDLETIVRKEFYHPACNGSISLRSMFLALGGSNGYDHLGIADDDNAGAAFSFMAMGKYANDGSKMIKRKLLDYSKQNTLALVQVHQKLLSFT